MTRLLPHPVPKDSLTSNAQGGREFLEKYCRPLCLSCLGGDGRCLPAVVGGKAPLCCMSRSPAVGTIDPARRRDCIGGGGGGAGGTYGRGENAAPWGLLRYGTHLIIEG